MFKNIFQNCDVYEITWKNMIEPDRSQMPINETLNAGTGHVQKLKFYRRHKNSLHNNWINLKF
jgi:hypothetical protein